MCHSRSRGDRNRKTKKISDTDIKGQATGSVQNLMNRRNSKRVAIPGRCVFDLGVNTRRHKLPCHRPEVGRLPFAYRQPTPTGMLMVTSDR